MATEAEVSDALAWATDTKKPPDKSVWEWLWEAVQGDFNDNRSTGQIAFDAAVSIIPVVRLTARPNSPGSMVKP